MGMGHDAGTRLQGLRLSAPAIPWHARDGDMHAVRRVAYDRGDGGLRLGHVAADECRPAANDHLRRVDVAMQRARVLLLAGGEAGPRELVAPPQTVPVVHVF